MTLKLTTVTEWDGNGSENSNNLSTFLENRKSWRFKVAFGGRVIDEFGIVLNNLRMELKK